MTKHIELKTVEPRDGADDGYAGIAAFGDRGT